MLPEKDKHIASKRQLLAMMRVSFGGRIAEQMFTGDQYNGTAGDIRQATNIARAMVTQFGMSDRLGFQLLGMDESRNPWEQPEKYYSDETAKIIDDEVKAVIDKTYAEATQIITDHRAQVEAVAKQLPPLETLTRDEIDRVMSGQKTRPHHRRRPPQGRTGRSPRSRPA